MINPVSFETAWSEAERRAYAVLVRCSGSEDNRDAFLGRNPGIVNAWHFESAPLQKAGDNAILVPDINALNIPYRAECVFLKREKCQVWAMRIMGGLPLTQDDGSNVATLRVSGIGDIVPDTILYANEKDPVSVWRMDLTFDLVFITGGKGNLAAPSGA